MKASVHVRTERGTFPLNDPNLYHKGNVVNYDVIQGGEVVKRFEPGQLRNALMHVKELNQ